MERLWWFKFPTSILHDPRLAGCDSADRWIFITFLCLCAESRRPWVFPYKDLGPAIRMGHIEIEEQVFVDAEGMTKDFLERGLIVRNKDGTLSPANPEDYTPSRFDPTTSERSKRYRESRDSHVDSNVSITPREEKSREEVEKRRKEENEKPGRDASAELPLASSGANGNGSSKSEVPETWKYVDAELRASSHLNRPKLFDWKWWDQIERIYEHNNELDYLDEIRKMDEWLSRKPTNRLKKDWQRFVAGWLKRAVEGG